MDTVSRATGLSLASPSAVVSRSPRPGYLDGLACRFALLVDYGRRDRNDLGVETALAQARRPLLGGQPERVGVIPGDPPLVGDALGSLELGGELVLAEVGLGDGPPRPSFLEELDPIGMRLMDSTPEAMAMSTVPEAIRLAARLAAWWLDPHWVSTVVAAVVIGRPAASQAVRPMLNDCSPTCDTHPVTTCWTAAGSTPVRSSRALRGTPSRSADGRWTGRRFGGLPGFLLRLRSRLRPLG